MYPLVIGLVLLALGGCAPELSWKIVGTKPGMTRQEAVAVLDYCIRSLPPPQPIPANLGLAAIPISNMQMEDRSMRVRICLEANGIHTADK